MSRILFEKSVLDDLDTIRGNKLAILVLVAHVETAESAPVFVDAQVRVAPKRRYAGGSRGAKASQRALECRTFPLGTLLSGRKRLSAA
jgi:hypothetical protein